MTDIHTGWYLVGYETEIAEGVAPLDIAGHRLMTVREGDRVRVFDATCPHRGAHLGHGGELDRNCVVCPFHGRRVRLGDPTRRYAVQEHPAMLLSGMLFMRFASANGDDRGFESLIREYSAHRSLVAVVNERLSVSPEMVIENAFDAEHFEAVHKVPNMVPFELGPSETGELAIQGRMGRGGAGEFFARAYSPTIVVTELRFRERTQVVITGTVPHAGGCTVRIGYAVRPEDEALASAWGIATRAGFLQDRLVWDHMDESAIGQLTPADEVVRGFWEFCEKFPRWEGVEA